MDKQGGIYDISNINRSYLYSCKLGIERRWNVEKLDES
nr:MAG TPA: hypothetical protein [Bacteriophage sp.]